MNEGGISDIPDPNDFHPILALLNFPQLFGEESDASSTSIGTILMKNQQPFTFESWKLIDKELLSI
jgi:hypothetical protein